MPLAAKSNGWRNVINVIQHSFRREYCRNGINTISIRAELAIDDNDLEWSSIHSLVFTFEKGEYK